MGARTNGRRFGRREKRQVGAVGVAVEDVSKTVATVGMKHGRI